MSFCSKLVALELTPARVAREKSEPIRRLLNTKMMSLRGTLRILRMRIGGGELINVHLVAESRRGMPVALRRYNQLEARMPR